jgi:hypothetical protein
MKREGQFVAGASIAIAVLCLFVYLEGVSA